MAAPAGVREDTAAGLLGGDRVAGVQPVGRDREQAGELDLALLFEFDEETPLLAEMARSPLLGDPMSLALPREHRLAKKSRLRLSELARRRGAISSGSPSASVSSTSG